MATLADIVYEGSKEKMLGRGWSRADIYTAWLNIEHNTEYRG